MKTIGDFLTSRSTAILLRRTLLLIDSRRGVKAIDEAVMDLFDEHAVPYQVGMEEEEGKGWWGVG